MPRHLVAPARARIRSALAASVVLALAGALALAAAAPASAATTQLLTDSFTGSTVNSAHFTAGGSYTPCLTVAGSPAGQTPASCSPATTDTDGNGALRLTDATGNKAGYLLFNHALPTRGGLDISFTQYQWGGSSADGIVFFLTEGSYQLTQVGSNGGGLGYNAKNATTGPGLPHALVGVGLDVYGNYPYEYNSAECTGVTKPTGLVKSAISVRGPAGDVTSNTGSQTGYCLLGAPVTVTGMHVAGTTRPAGVPVRITVDPPANTNPQISVYWNGATTPTVTVPEPSALVNSASKTFKFGWSASTGGSTDYHEVSRLSVKSLVAIDPALRVGSPASVATVPAGSSAAIPVTVTSDGDDGAESQPIQLTATVPTGASFAGTPSGSGWTCPVPSGSSVTCTWTPTSSAPLVPGDSPPVLTVPVTASASGSKTVAFSVTSSDNSLAASPSTSSTVASFAPVANPASGSGTASASPVVIAIQPTAPATTGTPSFAIATAPPAAEGTATIDAATGRISYTPKPGVSGRTTFTYTVTADGATSAPATVSVDVVPAAASTVVSTPVNTPITIDLASLTTGTGPVTYSVSDPDRGGTMTLSGSKLTFTPATGTTGAARMTYTVTDHSGLVSTTSQVTVNVTPTTTDTTGSGSLDATGHATIASSAPTGTGSGLSYAITDGPSAGSATIDRTTGVVTYTAAQGTSGTFVVGFSAGDGTTSTARHTATITVSPYAAGVSTSTTVGAAAITTPRPDQSGSGLRWSIVGQPAHGTASAIDAQGRVTYAPSGTESGTETVRIQAADSSGSTTPVVDVVIDVHPTVAAVAGSTTASDSPAGVAIAAAGAGTGLTYAIDPASVSSKLQSATVSGGSLVLTPKAGASGVLTATYTAADAAGLVSAPATVTLTVTPTAGDVAQSGTLDASGNATLVTPAPAGSGSGLRWVLDDDAAGRATINSLTGAVTYTAATDGSGAFTARYHAVDGDSVASPIRTATFTVRPYAAGVSVSTAVGGPQLTTPAPASAGDGLTWAVQARAGDPAYDGFDPATGRVTLTPSTTASGRATLQLVATDRDGVASAPVLVTIDTAPTAVRVSGSTTASASPAATGIAGGGTGSALVYALGTPSTGVASASVSGSTISITPAANASGRLTVPYTVTDASGLSASSVATLTVVPVAQGATIGAPNGDSTDVALPAASGSGLAYELIDGIPASVGTLTIDPDGTAHLVAKPGRSGISTAHYRVVGTDGIASDPAALTVDVLPTATDATTSGNAVHPAVVDLADRVTGTGPFTYAVTAPPALEGTTTLQGSQLTFRPVAALVGDIAIPFTATDADGLVASGTITVHVGPTLGDVAAETRLDGTGHATVTAPAPTTDAALPTFRITRGPSAGSATIDPDSGAITYTAAADGSGAFTVTYRVKDGVAGSDSGDGTAIFTVRPSASAAGASAVTGGPAVTTDAPVAHGTGPFTWQIVADPALGTATIRADGRLDYTPSSTASGHDGVVIRGTDAIGLTTGDLTVPIDVLPAAGDASAATVASASPASVPVTLAGLGTGPTYTATAASAKVDTVVVDGATMRITPRAGVSGVLTVQYVATDSAGQTSAPATVTLTVAPVAAPASVQVASGSTASAQLDAPLGRGPMTYTVVSAPSGVAVSISASGVLSVTAPAGTSGSFAPTYTVTDAEGVTSAPVTVALTVRPAVSDASATIPVGGTASVDLAALTSGTGPFGWAFTAPSASAGTATLSGSTLTFDAAAGFSGAVDVPFTATDAAGVSSAPGVVRITVQPATSDVSATGDLDASGAATIVTPAPVSTGGGTRTYAISTPPSIGGATIDAATGAITYTAQSGRSGVFPIGFTVSDGTSTSAERTATVTVRPFVGTGDASTTAGTAVDLPAPASAGTGRLTWRIVTGPAVGTATIDPATGAIHYVPASGASGTVTVVEAATDGSADRVSSAARTRTISVAPTVAAVSGTATTSSTPASVPVAASGVGTGLRYALTDSVPASSGTVAVSGTDIVFTPAPGFSGVLTVHYTATDGSGLTSAPATARLTVYPAGTDSALEVDSGELATVQLPASGTGPFTWTIGAPLPAGIAAATVDRDGVLTVTAADDYSGGAVLDYTVTDGSGTRSPVRHVAVSVHPHLATPAPVSVLSVPAGGDPVSATGQAAAAGTGPFAYAIDTAPPASAGTAVIDPTTGAMTFTPVEGWSGIVAIPVSVADANGEVAHAVWTVSVRPRVAASAVRAAVTSTGAPVSYSPPAPVGSGPFRYVLVSTPAEGGTVIDPATGVMTYTPTGRVSGVEYVQYAVIDAAGQQSSTGTIAVTVIRATGPAAIGAAALASTGIVPTPVLLVGILVLLAGVTLLLVRRRLLRAE